MRNVIEDGLVSLKTGRRERGECWCWENLQEGRQPLQGFDMFGGVKGWPVAVPPYKQIDVVVVHEEFVSIVKDAWEYLLLNGKQLALEEAGVKPEDLILVTHAGTHQDFYIHDFRPPPLPFGGGNNRQLIPDPRFAANPFHHQQTHGFHQPRSGGFGFGNPFNQPMIPSIVYLFTSLDAGHEPHWSSSPVFVPSGAGERPPLDRHFSYKIG
ncbi:hypothetical protein HYDPIDRAFT_98697 [Hydnomerulius pinastri MD-312]|uniref:Uncharacterized protein n=1 Tax=Hydnomerulius pinastri MD-312 TaxID=994086 RepID=A0A0C9WAG3_9AGAM|nr:hypothetical protein HYDPIDRAFT_98697 [Hydnomerulius pinastri MD-312]